MAKQQKNLKNLGTSETGKQFHTSHTKFKKSQYSIPSSADPGKAN